MLKLKRVRKSGITFIELISVVIILNILLISAQPSYMKYIQEKHEDNVKSQIFNIAASMERIKGRYFSYAAALDSEGNFISDNRLLVYPIELEKDRRFNITITGLTNSTFKITATPTELQDEDNLLIVLEQSEGVLSGYYLKDNVVTKTKWY